MSLEAMVWALNDSPVADQTEKLILMCLADKADPDGTGAYPSKATIAAKALIDEKTVQRKLAEMRRRRVIAYGDQALAGRIPAGKRPTVYDILIPASWFPNLLRTNVERDHKGLEPFTAENRPEIGEAPPRAVRSDKGKPRPKKTHAPGDAQPSPGQGGLTVPPVDNPGGGTVSPAWGDSESRKGGLTVPQTSPLNQPNNPSLTSGPNAREQHPATGRGGEEREEDHAPSTPHPAPTPPAPHGGNESASRNPQAHRSRKPHDAPQEPPTVAGTPVSREALEIAQTVAGIAIAGGELVGDAGVRSLAAATQAVIDLGYQPGEVRTWVTSGYDTPGRPVRSVFAVALGRLRTPLHRPLPDALEAAAEAPAAPRISDTPWCGECDHPTTRWIEVPDAGTQSGVRHAKCPRCHPRRAAAPENRF